MRHAFEFRHRSFLNDNFLALLRQYNVTFVVAHAGGKKHPTGESPPPILFTCDFYGEGKQYRREYSPREHSEWMRKIQNEAKIHAPTDALKLLKMLRVHTK